MAEIWDIYDENKKPTGRLAERGVYPFKENEFYIVVTGIILNSKNEILVSKRAAHKKFPFYSECNGGSILKGETSLQGMLRELKEELGLSFKENDAVFYKTIVRKDKNNFKDLWLFRRDIDAREITFPDGEATEAKWITIDEFNKMVQKNEIVPTIDFDENDYYKMIKMI